MLNMLTDEKWEAREKKVEEWKENNKISVFNQYSFELHAESRGLTDTQPGLFKYFFDQINNVRREKAKNIANNFLSWKKSFFYLRKNISVWFHAVIAAHSGSLITWKRRALIKKRQTETGFSGIFGDNTNRKVEILQGSKWALCQRQPVD